MWGLHGFFAHGVGSYKMHALTLQEPTPWAMGVKHALQNCNPCTTGVAPKSCKVLNEHGRRPLP